jgi:hypothetical protein
MNPNTIGKPIHRTSLGLGAMDERRAIPSTVDLPAAPAGSIRSAPFTG